MIRICDLIRQDERAVIQAASILHTAVSLHAPDAWPTVDSALREVHAQLEPERICRVALDDDDASGVVGIIAGHAQYDGHVWELHPLAVRPDRQRCGIGRRLVQDFEARVKERRGLTIILGSDDEDAQTSLSGIDLYPQLWDKVRTIQNLRGHPFGFYQSLGYTIIGVVPDANGIGKPDIIMGKRVA